MIQRKLAPAALAILGAVAGASLLGANDASAKGCNGYVNQLEWGCAPWDNNNGPQFPHYKKQEAQPAKPAAAAVPPPAASLQPRPAAPALATGGNGLVAQGGGNLVAQGGGNAVNKNGLVAQGGGNLKNK